MANAIRLIAVERGLDPRDFALIAFGGAGPLHARAVAERLDMRTVLVPPHPGLCSALGAAITEARVDRVQTFYAHSAGVRVADVSLAERRLREETIDELRRNVDADEVGGTPLGRPALCRTELRARGPAPRRRPRRGPLAGAARALRGRARAPVRLQPPRRGGRADQPPRDGAPARGAGTRSPTEPAERPSRARARSGSTPTRPVDCPIYRREELDPGAVLEGPAVIEEPDSTTLVFAGDRLLVHPSGVLVLTIGGAARDEDARARQRRPARPPQRRSRTSPPRWRS